MNGMDGYVWRIGSRMLGFDWDGGGVRSWLWAGLVFCFGVWDMGYGTRIGRNTYQS